MSVLELYMRSAGIQVHLFSCIVLLLRFHFDIVADVSFLDEARECSRSRTRMAPVGRDW